MSCKTALILAFIVVAATLVPVLALALVPVIALVLVLVLALALLHSERRSSVNVSTTTAMAVMALQCRPQPTRPAL